MMKVLIIYFSQTGGTEKIAKKINDGILASGNECKLVKLKEVSTINLKDFDVMGLGCPTFFYREPMNVKKFIQNIEMVDKKPCFIFCTHGSVMGNTFYHMSEELGKRGYLVIGSFDSYSESSLQFYPKEMHTAGHPDENELSEAKQFGENICETSLKISSGQLDLIPKFELVENTWWARDSKLMTLEFLRKLSPVFTINGEACTKCGTCQDNCPVDAIDITRDPPEIQKEGCIFCWFCEKSCPEGAIKADWSFMIKSTTFNLKRYIKELKKAEEEGKFRPHVEYEKIF